MTTKSGELTLELIHNANCTGLDLKENLDVHAESSVSIVVFGVGVPCEVVVLHVVFENVGLQKNLDSLLIGYVKGDGAGMLGTFLI